MPHDEVQYDWYYNVVANPTLWFLQHYLWPLARAWPGARLHLTSGLGHGRILRDRGVAQAAADFLCSRSSVASVAAPALPAPAPLY